MDDGRTTIDRLVAEGIRDAGRAFLLEGPGAGAARSSETLRSLLGGLAARVWMIGEEGEPEGEAKEAPPPLATFLGELLTREGHLEEWARLGREAEPVMVELQGRDGEAAARLRKSGAVRVLLIPLVGTSKVLGAFGVSLPPGAEPSAEQLDAARLVAELTGIGLDVVARGLAARGTEERLRRFIRQLPDPALLLDSAGVVRDVSETIREVAGVASRAVVGHSIGWLVLEEDRKAVEEAVRLALEGGSFRGTFGVAGRRRGERRELELNMRRFSGRRVVAVARDVTRRVRRERSLRVMLEHTTHLMSAASEEELWERLKDAITALLPQATYVWVYRGTERGARVVWSSRPGAPRWEFSIRGWGADVMGLLRQEEGRGEFLARYGSDRRMARQQLNAILSGQGTPMLLDRPAEQLSVFLADRELHAILEFWGDEPPGQLIHCPVIVDGRLELLVVVDAPPGERPFDHEDAAFPWQLTNLAHQALRRIEAFALARRQLAELQAFREAVRQVAEAQGAAELMEILARRAVWAVEADAGCLLLAEPGGWRCQWGSGEGVPPVGKLVQLPQLPERSEGGLKSIYLEDAGKDRAWAQMAGEVAASVAVVPLVAMGRRLGVLVLTNDSRRSFDASDREMAEFFADELALVVAQERLARSSAEAEALTGAVMAAVDQGLVVAGADGRLVRANRRALALLGVSGSPTAGQSVLEIFPPSQRGQVAHGLAEVMEKSAGQEAPVATDGGGLLARFHPLSGGGCLIVLSARPDREGGRVPAEAADHPAGGAPLGGVFAGAPWKDAERAASRLNDLLTALAGRLELEAVPAESPVHGLAEEACKAARELRELLAEVHPEEERPSPEVIG